MTLAALKAKDMKLIHIGNGYYTDSDGTKKYHSIDGINISPLTTKKLSDVKKISSTLATQENPTMPNPLGEPSKIKKDKPTTKKRKSLVEFFDSYNKKKPEWLIRYQLTQTGKKIHMIYINADSQRDATIIFKSSVYDGKMIGSPVKQNKLTTF
jgi:hypothetical protein